MENDYLDKLINDVGPSNFLKYFDLFARNYELRPNKIFYEAFAKEDWKDNSKCSIASKGKKIFRESREIEVLKYLSISSFENIAVQASEILKRYKQ
ncbi:MAG: hypothetical protein SNG38_07165 [Rikenellaceae bacterium]